MPTTTERGLGNQHQQQRKRLMAALVDGTPCPCGGCGPACPCRPEPQPMYRDAKRNVDRRALQADHPLGRGSGRMAERLLLATCNGSLGGRLAHVEPCPHHGSACGSFHSRRW